MYMKQLSSHLSWFGKYLFALTLVHILNACFKDFDDTNHNKWGDTEKEFLAQVRDSKMNCNVWSLSFGKWHGLRIFLAHPLPI